MSFFGNYFGGGGACDYPAETDVRYGVEYGSGVYTGSLLVAGTLGTSEPLIHSPAEILSQLLIDLDLGVEPEIPAAAWSVYYGSEPADPDRCITTYDTQGRDGGRMHATGLRDEHPGIQIRIRADTHRVGFAKAKAIAHAIDTGVVSDVVTMDDNTTRYHVWNVTRTGNVLAIGKEPTSQRAIFTVNVIATIKRLTLD